MAPKAVAPSAAEKRLAQRVEQALERTTNKEPKHIHPSKVLVSTQNRNGAPPNVQHVHHTILKSFITKGFDYSRPPVGICVEVKSPEGKLKLLEHNKKFLSPSCLPCMRRAVFSTHPLRART